MKKYYSVELKEQTKIDALKVKLKGMSIYYEASECYNMVHFEILLTVDEVNLLNNFLDTI
jgi:uncharacterized ParB-like nuclease family protein